MKTLKHAMMVVTLLALAALMGPASFATFAGTPGAAAKNAHAARSRADKARARTRPAGKVSINKATVAQLASLPRIGPKTAQRIVDYRTAHKGFKTLDELQNVKGIGAKTLERIRPHITL
jgi:competence protein ComEA